MNQAGQGELEFPCFSSLLGIELLKSGNHSESGRKGG
jgi:hypothetical protein